jgi:hypothetical protein
MTWGIGDYVAQHFKAIGSGRKGDPNRNAGCHW